MTSTTAAKSSLAAVIKLLALVALIGVGGAAFYFYYLNPASDPVGRWVEPAASGVVTPPAPPKAVAPPPGTASAATPVESAPAGAIQIGIAYGTEKKYWLEAAVKLFADTDDGRRIRVKLIPMGSIEGAHAVLRGDERIHVWSPASAMYLRAFEEEWGATHTSSPIVRGEALALTPMVFVMWKERYDAFVKKYDRVSFRTLGEAMRVSGGWGGIADRPQWGLFKLGYTNPNQSNSGLMTLILLAYDINNKDADLKIRDLMQPEFQDWVGLFARGAAGPLSNSTGNLMKEMVLKGPSSYDALVVYESVVIDYLENAENRWQPLQVAYPQVNVWNDNPYYILDVPWSTPEHRQAAETFLGFLMSREIQTMALKHGFRPGDPRVPIKFPESPFETLRDYGLQIDLEKIGEYPSPEVINNLQQSWLRAAELRGL
ncbi:MAG: substrate-binding domain-containing protein [Planctomycetota bacterium]